MFRPMVLLALLAAVLLPLLTLPAVTRAGTTECYAYVFDVVNLGDSPTTYTVALYLVSNPQKQYSKSYVIGPHKRLTKSFYHAFDAEGTFVAGGATGNNVDLLQDDIRQVDSRFCSQGASDGLQWLTIGDGRINDGPDQLGAPLAGYCLADGSISMWDIADDGHGTLGFVASAADIAQGLETAKATGQNQLIGSGLGNSLYALTSGEIELRGPDLRDAGKLYSFVAPSTACAPAAA